MVSAPSHLLFIYLSSLDLLEIGNWNWKLDHIKIFQRARERKRCTTDTGP